MKKHTESRTKTLVVCSFIGSIIAILFSIIALCPSIPRLLNDDNLQFDYLGLIIGILSLLITVLIGWNIFQLIDFKEKINQIDELKDQTAKRLNEIQHESDYNQALLRAMRSQNASIQFAPNDKKLTKYVMITSGLKALNFFSEFPEYEEEMSKLSTTLTKGLRNSLSTKLEEINKTDLLIMCGEIKNKEKIPNFDKIVNYINKCDEKPS